MLQELLTVVEPYGLTPREIAEALWLAPRLSPSRRDSATVPAEPASEPTVTPLPKTPQHDDARAAAEPPGSEPDPATSTIADPMPPLRLRSTAGEVEMVGGPAAVAALPQALHLARGLRPFRRAVDMSGPPQVDEDATATAIAETGIWMPRLVPTPVRRFEVAIVVDESSALAVWHRTVRAVERLLVRTSSFRQVRVWSLYRDGPDDLLVRRRGTDAGPGARPAERLTDPTGRQIVLLFSDCVGALWDSERLPSVLRSWAAGNPVAVLQPLPFRMWRRCSTRPVSARLSRTGSGASNSELAVHPRGAVTGLPVPVVELSPSGFSRWSRLVAGEPYQQVHQFVLDTDRLRDDTRDGVDPYAVNNPEQLLREFRAGSSPDAYRLAGYLSAVPLIPPLMRLVQARMLPESRPSDLAEVFLGGLIARGPARGRPGEPIVEFDFRPRIREYLLNTLRRSEIRHVLDEAADFVDRHLGAGYDVPSFMRARPDALEPLTATPVAAVTTTVLRALGGRHADVADRLAPPILENVVGAAPRTRTPPGGDMNRAQVPEDARPSAAVAGSPPEIFNGMPTRNFRFSGREELLASIHDQLWRNDGRACALYGLGGVGKTQLAAEYCYRFQDRYQFVWWVSAEQDTQLRATIARMAPDLDVPELADQAVQIEAVLNALRRGRKYQSWLIVLDNAPEPDAVQKYFRNPGHILITSRDRGWASAQAAQAFEVDTFSRRESMQLLRAWDQHIDEADASALAARLGDLPIALEQAAAYCRAAAVSPRDYVRLLDRNAADTLDQNTAPGYGRSVRETFRLAFKRLRKQSPAAAQMLELAAVFGPEPVSRRLRRAAWEVDLPKPLSEVIQDDLQFNKALSDLGRLSLVRQTSDGDALQLHRLLRELVRQGLTDENRRRYQNAAQEILAKANPSHVDDPRNWSELFDIAPHVQDVDCASSDKERVRRVVLDQVRFLYTIGDYRGSSELGEPVHKSWSERPDLGREAVETLLMARHLGNSLRELGRYDEARRLNQDTWESLKATAGEESLHALVMANSVGADLRINGRWREAYELDLRTLELHRAVFGDDDLNTLRSDNNNAVDLRALGRYREALTRSRALRARAHDVLGRDHPLTYQIVTNMARDYYEVGNYQQAHEELDETLDDFQVRVGKAHANVLRGKQTFAATLLKLGRVPQAKAVMADVMRIYRERYNAAHLDAIGAAVTSAKILHAEGQSTRATNQIEKARQRFAALLGEEHPFTLACSVNLGILRRATGDHAQALVIDTQAAAAIDRLLGRDHPFSLCVWAGIATDKHLAGDVDEAVEISRDVLERSGRVRGAEHPNTRACASNLALDIYAAGRGSGSPVSGQRAEFDIELPAI